MTQLSTGPGTTAPAQATGDGAGSRAAAEARLQQISRQAQAMSLLREVSLLPVLVLLIVVGSVISPVFLRANNLWGIGQQASALAVATVGEALALMIGSMDLSIGGTYGFAPMVAAWLVLPSAEFGAGLKLDSYVGLLVLLLIGGAIGMVNGFLIVKARLNAFIITLGMLILLGGAQDGIVSGQTLSGLPEPLWYLGLAFWGPVPVSLVATVVVLTGVGLFLRYHRVGRAVFAVGGNAEAARAAGINVDRVKIGVYTAAGVLAALGGMMEMGRVQAITADQGYGEGIIFVIFASAVIGGVSLLGGKGNLVGVATGVALLSVVQNILDLKNVNAYWVEAVYGLAILVALMVARVIGGSRSQT